MNRRSLTTRFILLFPVYQLLITVFRTHLTMGNSVNKSANTAPQKDSEIKCDLCPDIYHCSLELLRNKKKWTVVWPLLMLDNSAEMINDKNNKILYLFDNKHDRDHEYIDKSVYKWIIGHGFTNVYEYFACNKDISGKDRQYHFILHRPKSEKYIFKCKNAKQRRMFIDAITETIYYQKDSINKVYGLISNNDMFEFKYKPIYYYIQQKHQFNYSLNSEWFNIPIDIGQQDSKFLLSIKCDSSNEFIITINNLNDIINFMFSNYYKFTNNEMLFDDEDKTLIQTIIKARGLNARLSYNDRLTIAKHGISVHICGIKYGNSRMPILHGVNCIKHDGTNESKEDSKEVENDIDNKENSNNDNCNVLFNSDDVCLDGFNCKIYKKMKNDYEYTESNYKHLVEKNHFNFDYSNKEECKYHLECKSFQRLARMNEDKNNYNCHRFDDLCHVCIYRHPPRIDRNQKMTQTCKFNDQDVMHQFVERKDVDTTFVVDKSLDKMINEIVTNGFEQDLCLTSDDLQKKHYSLLSIVNEKLQSKMHKVTYFNQFHYLYHNLNQDGRAAMLALVMYTGCDCNYDLCKSQRNGNYAKWPTLDINLYYGISILSSIENYSKYFDDKTFLHLYSGLYNVRLKNNTKLNLFYFPTYTSTSYDKNESKKFAQNDGMLIQFDSNIIKEKQFDFCSVEWISKFPSECEILLARSRFSDWGKAATMKVIDYEINTTYTDDNINMNNNNNKNSNNNHHGKEKSLQIVKLSQLDSKKNNIVLLNHMETIWWEEIFWSGLAGKQRAMNIFNKSYIAQINQKQNTDYKVSDFNNGINLLYNDNTFKKYCIKFQTHNKGYFHICKLNQNDVIQMQLQSDIVKQLLLSKIAHEMSWMVINVTRDMNPQFGNLDGMIYTFFVHIYILFVLSQFCLYIYNHLYLAFISCIFLYS